MLTEPEKYLDAINYVLLGIVGCTVAVATRSVFRRTGRLIIALALPTLLLTSVSILDSLGQVTPEPLLIALALMAVLLVVPVPDIGRAQQFQRAALFGIVLGAGIVTKVTFVPVAMLMLALPSIACALLAVTLAIVSMGMLTYPISPPLHCGDACLGTKSFSRTKAHTVMVRRACLPYRRCWRMPMACPSSEPLLPVAAGALLMAMILVGFRHPLDGERRAWLRFCAAGALLMAGQLVLVAKHPHPHYLVPAIAAAALLAPVALHVMAPASGVARYLAPAIIVLSLPLLVDQPRQWMAERLGSTSRAVQATQHLLEVAAQRDCLVLPYYDFQASHTLFISAIPLRAGTTLTSSAQLIRTPLVLQSLGGRH